MNFFPAYRGTGGRIHSIAHDWSSVEVRIPLNWRTRNYVGTIFGGSIYGAVDPIYMMMLLQILGPEFVVWDKSARIRFLRPGRSTLTARFSLAPEELSLIREKVHDAGKIERHYSVQLIDTHGAVCASVEKVVYIASKTHYKARKPSSSTENFRS